MPACVQAGAGAESLSCQLLLWAGLACIVELLVCLHESRGADIMSIEAESLSSPLGNREHYRLKADQGCGQGGDAAAQGRVEEGGACPLLYGLRVFPDHWCNESQT